MANLSTKFRSLNSAMQLLVAAVLLVLLLQTFCVLGLIMPVQVAGSSMAPTLMGPAVDARCPKCGALFQVGAEFAAETTFAACPRCENQRVPLDRLAVRASDRLVIDRTAFARRDPRRGEVVVIQNPTDGSERSVKRVVGLPRETVEIRHGDVWIDGRPWVKSLVEQRAMRQRVEREGAPITDDFVYNAGLSRKPLPVRDFMLTGQLKIQGPGSLHLTLNDGLDVLRINLDWPSASVTASADGKQLGTTVLSDETRERLGDGAVLLEVSNFDRQLLLAIDSREELRCPLAREVAPPSGTSEPFSVETMRSGIQLSERKVYRDIYFTRQAVDRAPGPERVTLGDDEYYLLGDNSPISVDSRSWGGVPRRFLIGRPPGVR